MEPSELAKALAQYTPAIETLQFSDIFYGHIADHWISDRSEDFAIGSLQHFPNLRYLDIEQRVLLGDPELTACITCLRGAIEPRFCDRY